MIVIRASPLMLVVFTVSSSMLNDTPGVSGIYKSKQINGPFSSFILFFLAFHFLSSALDWRGLGGKGGS